jgi:hypothetical protein
MELLFCGFSKRIVSGEACAQHLDHFHCLELALWFWKVVVSQWQRE